MEEGLEILNNKKVLLSSPKKFLLLNLVNLYRQTKHYAKTEETLKEILSITFYAKGTDLHLGLYSTYVMICFHQNDYQKAYEIYNDATYQENLKKNRKSFQERFKLFEAFIHFFIAIGKIDTTKSEYPPLPKFRLSRFINDVPEFAQDKRKQNINLIIIQVLFLIQQKKYDVVIDKVEALNMYCHRYLKKDDTFRSNCFIKMLLTLPRSNFNRIAVERNAKKLVNQLKSVPIEKAIQAEDLELVPYDDLWDIVLEMLEAPTKKVVK